MPARLRAGLFPLLGLAALLAALACGSEGRAGPKGSAKQVAKEQVKFKEAEALKAAYILLTVANHDYDGHRAKAMKQVEEAAKILDVSILKKGSWQQEAAALMEDKAAAAAKAAAKATPKIHEAQVLSDAQLRRAGELLLQVRAVLAQHNQKKVFKHVEDALEEINVALKIR